MSALTTCMDVIDFMHVNFVYLSQQSRGVGPSIGVPNFATLPTLEVPMLLEPTGGEGTMAPLASRPLAALVSLTPLSRADFNVGDYLNPASLLDTSDFGG